MTDRERFDAWFHKRWPEFPHPNASAWEAYQRGVADERFKSAAEIERLRVGREHIAAGLDAAEEDRDALRADLRACRGAVKAELHHYERVALVHGRTPLAASYEAEAQRWSALLDRIDALPTPEQMG